MKLLIIGAGGHGRVVADAAESLGTWAEIAFLDDERHRLQKSSPWPIVGSVGDLTALRERYDAAVVGIADVRLRLDLLRRAAALGFATPSIVHPSATVSPRAELGPGTVVFAGGVVNVGVRAGLGVIVNTGATVDHDCSLGDGVHICPGAHLAGGVQVGARTWFGIGAVARQNIRIGSDVTVGAGAVCVSDIKDAVTVVGVPAKEMQ